VEQQDATVNRTASSTTLEINLTSLVGGHTKTASYRNYQNNVARHGAEGAINIARFESANMEAMHKMAKKHLDASELTVMDTVDIFYDVDTLSAARSAVEALKNGLSEDEGASQYTFWNERDAVSRFRCPGAIGALTYPAGSLNARGLTLAILRDCIEKGMSLYTHTNVNKISKGSDGIWKVRTDRGAILARKVVLATNAYTSALYHRLENAITPCRGQITAQRPGGAMPQMGLPYTYSFVHTLGSYEYMVSQQPSARCPGDILIGSNVPPSTEEGTGWASSDDSLIQDKTSEHLRRCTTQYFRENWGVQSIEGQVRQEWAGIMAYSKDGMPIVGELEPGLWVAASFQGHGMVNSWLSGQKVAHMLRGVSADALDAPFPMPYLVTEARLSALGATRSPKLTSNL
jgi:glycine/D-amino acid oxidase-like deaminating enzyme